MSRCFDYCLENVPKFMHTYLQSADCKWKEFDLRPRTAFLKWHVSINAWFLRWISMNGIPWVLQSDKSKLVLVCQKVSVSMNYKIRVFLGSWELKCCTVGNRLWSNPPTFPLCVSNLCNRHMLCLEQRSSEKGRSFPFSTLLCYWLSVHSHKYLFPVLLIT